MNSSSINWGTVVAGYSSSQHLTLSNQGTTSSITLSQISTTGTGFSVSGFTTPATLTPGQSVTLNVVYLASGSGTVSATMSITSNASNSPATVALSADVTAPAPQLSLNPPSALFGNVNTGGNSTQIVTISNPGNSTLTITQASMSGSAAFTMSGLTTPVSVNAGSSTTFSVKFAPTTAAAVTGSISLTSDASGSPTALALTGTGVTPSTAQLTLNPTSVPFGNVNVGSSATQSVTVSNPGTSTLTISQITASGAYFSDSGLTAPVTVNAGSSTTLSVKFAPTTAGAASGSITLTSNASSSPNTLSLTGTGTAPQISLSPSPVAFGTVTDGSSSAKTVTITNAGSATLTITNAAISGTGFTMSGLTNPLNVAAGGGTSTFSVTFTPSGTTAASGSVTLTSNVAGSPTTLSLTGTGGAAPAPQITVTPSSVAFGAVVDGTTNSQTITLKNTGNATLTITSATPSGTGYSVSGIALPLNIAAGASSTFNVNFAPTGTSAVTGSVSLVSNVATSPTAIGLTGTGVAATLVLGVSSNNVSFGNVNDGTTGSQTVTLTNTGNSNLTISSIGVTGTGFGTSGVNPPVTLTPTQKVTLTLTFVPTGSTSASGTVTIASNATVSPATIAVSGTGVVAVQHSAALSWTASTSTVSGYNIYRSTTSGSGYVQVNPSLVNGLTYTDTTVAASTIYYYVATSVDGSGNESGYSNQATATIP